MSGEEKYYCNITLTWWAHLCLAKKSIWIQIWKMNRNNNKTSKMKSFQVLYLHVGVDHLLELVRRHLRHRVDQVQQLSAHRIVGPLSAGQNCLDVLKKIGTISWNGDTTSFGWMSFSQSVMVMSVGWDVGISNERMGVNQVKGCEQLTLSQDFQPTNS